MKANMKRSGRLRSGFLMGVLLLASSAAHADWCQLHPGWNVVTHGNRAENVATAKAGKFETVVEVGGSKITVRGAVVNGVVKIGTFFIPK